MTIWPNLVSNEQVTHDEVQWAIANNYLAIRPGQVADTGIECISSVQAIGWLFIDSDYMPPLDRGELPVRGDFVALPATIRVTSDETYVPRIDINLFVSIDDNTIAFAPGNFDQTYTVKGGSVLAAVVQSLEASSANNALKHLRISNNNQIVLDSSNPNLATNIVWSERIAPGSNWFIEAFGSADAPVNNPPTGNFIYTNNTSYEIPYSVYNVENTGEAPTLNGTLAPNTSINVVPYIPGPSGHNFVIKFLASTIGRYFLTSTPGNSAAQVTCDTVGDIINSIDTNGLNANMGNGLTGVSFSYASLHTQNIKFSFYTNDGYPTNNSYVQIIDDTTGQPVQILDYNTGIYHGKVYNPGSYTLSYFDLLDDGGSFHYVFVDTGGFSNSSKYKLLSSIYPSQGELIGQFPISKGATITGFTYSKSQFNNNAQPLKLQIKKS